MNEHKPLQMNFKKKQRKAVLKLVALLLVVVTLLLSSAWAWFRGEDAVKATATGLTISMKSEEGLKISVNDGSYTMSLDILDGSDILNDLDMVPVTGLGYKRTATGDTFLYIPEIKYAADGTPELDRTVAWTQAVANVDYISLKIKFMTEYPADIYIGSGTSVITESETMGKALAGADAGNISRYGDFSRDAIVGALRMSVAYPEETLRCIWIPRPDVQLVTNEAGEYALNTNVAHSGNWSGEHYYYGFDTSKTPGNRIGCASSSGAFTATTDGAGTAHASSMVGTTVEEGDAYTCTAYIKIWFDGCDSEAVRALSRGRFRINLNFVAVEVGQ